MIAIMRVVVRIIYEQELILTLAWTAAQHAASAQIQPHIVDDVAAFVLACPLASRVWVRMRWVGRLLL